MDAEGSRGLDDERRLGLIEANAKDLDRVWRLLVNVEARCEGLLKADPTDARTALYREAAISGLLVFRELHEDTEKSAAFARGSVAARQDDVTLPSHKGRKKAARRKR